MLLNLKNSNQIRSTVIIFLFLQPTSLMKSITHTHRDLIHHYFEEQALRRTFGFSALRRRWPLPAVFFHLSKKQKVFTVPLVLRTISNRCPGHLNEIGLPEMPAINLPPARGIFSFPLVTEPHRVPEDDDVWPR